jgi:hypothetical protein
VAEALHETQEALKVAAGNPVSLLTDVLHRAAWEGGLGQPISLEPQVGGDPSWQQGGWAHCTQWGAPGS